MIPANVAGPDIVKVDTVPAAPLPTVFAVPVPLVFRLASKGLFPFRSNVPLVVPDPRTTAALSAVRLRCLPLKFRFAPPSHRCRYSTWPA